MRRVLAACVLALAGSASCVIVDPGCSTSAGASIYVSPAVVIVAVGASVTPVATERRCDGRREDRVYPRWTLLRAADSSIVTLDASTGRITGRRPGDALVSARPADYSGEATVSVTVR
jgi:uncharacterized membrane protein